MLPRGGSKFAYLETFKDRRLGFSKRPCLRQSMEITIHGDPLKKGCVTLRCPSQCRWMRDSPRSPMAKTNGSSREGNRTINPHSRIPKSINKQTNKQTGPWLLRSLSRTARPVHCRERALAGDHTQDSRDSGRSDVRDWCCR